MTTPDKEEMPTDMTAGPWIVHYGEAVKIKDANGYTVASLSQIHLHGRRSKNEVEKTARFIVAACNAYEPMREALAKKDAEIERLRTALERNGSMDFFRDGAKHMHDAIVSQKFHIDWGTAATPSSGAALAFDLTKDLAAKTLAALSTLPVNDRQTSDDVGRLRALLEEELVWHEERDKSLSKQPPFGEKGWRRAEHQERIDVIRAALKGVPQPATRHPEQIGWLVEMNDAGPKYYSFSEHDPDDPWGGFQREAGNATRFARKEDAEAIIAAFAWTPGHVFASEHVWGGEKIEQPASEAGKLSSEAES